MKIYTKNGDLGRSDLIGGFTTHKADHRFQTMGDLDELNAWLGMVKLGVDKDEAAFITQIQGDIVTMMAHVAALGGKQAGKHTFSGGLEAEMEKRIDKLSEHFTGNSFDFPGANETSAKAHVARTVCRRAERTLVVTGWDYPISHESLVYINRLSDYLYALAVSEVNKEKNNEE